MGSVLRAAFDGVVDSLNNDNIRAMIDECLKRLTGALRVVQFDNPLPCLVARISHAFKKVHFREHSIVFTHQPSTAGIVSSQNADSAYPFV